MERCTNANLSKYVSPGLIGTESEVMFLTRLCFVEFKEIVWSNGRLTVQDFVDHIESVA